MTDYCNTNVSGLLSVKDALHAIYISVTPLTGTESVPIKYALGRILAGPVISPNNIPGFRNSSMDGFAFSSSDIAEGQPFSLRLAGTSWAGKPFFEKVTAGNCVKIFTGAVLPEGTDSVVMQEEVSNQGEIIQFPVDTRPFQNIRYPGEDIKKGQQLLRPNKTLTAIDLGLLASAGIYDVPVKRKIKIAFLSTGDELIAIGNKLRPGQIYDSNRYTLTGMLDNHTWDAADLGVISDDQNLLKNCLLQAAQDYDVIISTGGASVGEADFIKQILDEIGKVNFWKIAMKPGKPLAYGKIGSCYYFGLPGNPVSVIATFQKIVVPSLQRLSGAEQVKPLRIQAKCSCPLKKTPGRQEFQRGILSQLDNGEFSVSSAGQQGSHILSSISRANCYIVLPANCTDVTEGESVVVEPFSVFI